MSKKAKGLGRGLDALLGQDRDVAVQTTLPSNATPDLPSRLPVDWLSAGKYQPRTRMDEGALNELADSIRQQGIMQPILVRAIGIDQYEVIAGERRLRAARLAGLNEVPVLVREVPDEQAAVLSLIENLQREDLNALEEAHGVQRLIDEFGMTHDQAAHAVGRSRSATTNLLRLLNLAGPVQTMLLAGDLDMGHARALLPLDGAAQLRVAHEVVARRLSVRETEKRVAQVLAPNAEHAGRSGSAWAKPRDVLRLEEALSDRLGTRVELKLAPTSSKDQKKQAGMAGTHQTGKGQIMIEFHDWSHLNALLEQQGLADVISEEAA